MADPEYVAEEFEKARQALADAEQLATGAGSDEGIVNRLYYAAFHPAQAVLYDRDVAPSSHGAIRNRFGEVVVLEGDATREQGRLLTTLGDLRQQPEYGYEPIDADVATLQSQTEAFLADMEELVGGEGRDGPFAVCCQVADGSIRRERARSDPADRASGGDIPVFRTVP